MRNLLGAAALLAISLAITPPPAAAGTLGTLSSSSQASANGGTGGFMTPFGSWFGPGSAVTGDQAYGSATLLMGRGGVSTTTTTGTQGYGYSGLTGFTTFGGMGNANANANVVRGFFGFPPF